MRRINVHRPAARPATLPITLMPRGSLICCLSTRVTGNNTEERRSWEGLLIHAINDKSIDCFKDSDVGSDLERLLCNVGAQRSFADIPPVLQNSTGGLSKKKKTLNVNFTLLHRQM